MCNSPVFQLFPNVKKVENKKCLTNKIFLCGPKYNRLLNVTQMIIPIPKSQNWHINTLILMRVIFDPLIEECRVQSLGIGGLKEHFMFSMSSVAHLRD